MNDLRKAAEMALEALCSANPIGHALEDYEYHNKATEALRQALAQPEQEPVEPPDYVEPITFDYHEGWEAGFKAGVEAKAKEQK